MNEVLRFRKNRMVSKFLHSGKFGIILNDTNPDKPIKVRVDENGRWIDINAGTPLTPDQIRRVLITDNTYESPNESIASRTAYNSAVKQGLVDAVEDMVPAWGGINYDGEFMNDILKIRSGNLSNQNALEKLAEKLAEEQAKRLVEKLTRGRVTGLRRPRKTPLQWASEFQTFMGGLTSELFQWLKLNGLDNAQALQTYLDNNGYYDAKDAKLNVDNKFGDNSKAAWGKFVASGIMGKNRDQEIYKEKQKAVEPVLDAADPFGYKTSNTYEGDDFADRLKGMGIRSNADLINFMHNSAKAGWKGDAWQTQFRSDVDRALGGDYSDANIRRTFHTKNGWGGGFLGKGDFTDFQNALQTNAGVWNGMYERKESDARMDAARKQAAERMAKQYVELNPIKLKPIPEELTRKYGVNARPAASTLGTAGAGSMGKIVKPYDWVEEALKSGQYFPQPETITGKEEFVPLDWMLQAAKTGYLPQQ